jgi:acetyl esterase/lipase
MYIQRRLIKDNRIEMKFISRIFLAYFFITGFIIAQNSPTLIKDISYASVDGRNLKLDLYMPTTVKNPYLVVWVHGGAWHSGTKDNPPDNLLKSGYAMASVEYRLSTEARFPAMVFDIKAAIRFLRAQAEHYGYRKDKITIWGSSAGGHLAALVGTTNGNPELEGKLGKYLNESSSVQAIIDFYGPTDFLTILVQSTPHGISVRAPALALLLGRPVEQVPDLAKLASPVYQIDKSDSPILIMHGDQDNQVPVNQAIELKEAYDEKGLDATLIFVRGAGHADPLFLTEKYMNIVKKFLKQVLNN